MFIQFLINKLFQNCSARTGFTPMHDAFVALSVANDLLDQVFVCQAPVHCIDQKHNILMSAITQTESVIFKQARIHNLDLRIHHWENGVKQIKINEENLSQTCILCQLLRTKTLASESKYIQHFFIFTTICLITEWMRFI